MNTNMDEPAVTLADRETSRGREEKREGTG